MISPNTRHNLNKWSTCIGCFLLLIPYGQTFYWGNMYTYVKSYLIHYSGTSPAPDGPWLITLKITTTGVTSLISGLLVLRTGESPLLIVGIVLTSASYFLTYLAVKTSRILLFVSFGVLLGLADGFVLTVATQTAVNSAGSRVGMFLNIVRSGMCIGAISTNAFVTWYANPENKVPDQQIGPVLYFSQLDILNKVPSMFIILGSACTIIQIVGFVLVRIKSSTEKKETLANGETCGQCEYSQCGMHCVTRKGDEQVSSENQHHCTLSPQTESSQILPFHNQISPSLSSSSSTSSPLPHQLSPSPVTTKRSSLSSSSSQTVPLSSDTSSNHLNPSGQSDDMTPRQMMTTLTFYTLCLMCLANTTTYVIITTYYKEFGQLWIADDFLLARIGMAMPIATIFFSTFWGFLMDSLSMKVFFIIYNVCLVIFSCFYSFTPRLSTWAFSTVTVIYGGIVCPLFMVYNTATAKLFGKTHYALNQGIFFLPTIPVDFIIPPMCEAIIVSLGWDYIFLIPASANAVGLMTVAFTNFGHR